MIRVTDVDAALRFYVGGLGMTVLDRPNVSSRHGTVHCLGYDGNDGGCLQLLHDPDARGPYLHGSGYGHIAIGSPDVGAMVARLTSMGIEALRHSAGAGAGPAVASVRDPEGYSLELIRT
jgi:lactoylglutathione lyase